MKTLEEIIQYLKDNAKEDTYFKFYEQKNTDVENYFKTKFNCKHIPKELLEFYKKYDGAAVGIMDIYTMTESPESFENGSRLEDWKPEEIELDEVVEFATNGCGDSLYFMKNEPDEKIYFWSHEGLDFCYDSFNELLFEEIQNYLSDDF